LETMTSQSNENVSMVALEFDDDTNMDAATLDIRENLDLIESSFPDGVGNATILKLSMDMMPVLVTAIDSDQMDSAELSEYVNNTLIPGVESVNGVATVSSSGLMENNINVVINSKKIARLNKRIQNAINGEFDEASEQLDEAEDRVNEAQSRLETEKTSANRQIAKAKKALNDAQLSVIEREIQVTSAKVTLE